MLYPWGSSSRLLMLVGGTRLIREGSGVTLTWGASGQGASVVGAPPVLCLASSTTVLAPDRARYAAATSPLCPPPTTIASYVAAMSPPSASSVRCSPPAVGRCKID